MSGINFIDRNRTSESIFSYIEFFVSDEIAGPDGPLAEYGLVSDPELAKTQEMVAGF